MPVRPPAPAPIRVAFVSLGGHPWGGSEELWYHAALRVRDRGHTVAVGYYRWPTPPPQLAALAARGCEVHQVRRLMAARRGLEALFRRPVGLGLGWLRRFRPDLVVQSVGTHLPHPTELAVPDLAARIGSRYVVVIHAASEYVWPPDAVLARYEERYRRADACCFVSEANRRVAEAQFGRPLPNARVVANPVHPDAAEILPWPDDRAGLRLACVGRLQPGDKGQDVLFRVLARPEWRARPVRVDLFGTGPNEGTLRRLADTLGLGPDRVRFAGTAGIRAVWADHHGLALASRVEGLPLTVVEAMRCGRVPVVTAVAGNPEVVTDGETGFLAGGATDDLYAAALEAAWRRWAEWPEIGRRAAAAVRARFPADPIGEFVTMLTEVAATCPQP